MLNYFKIKTKWTKLHKNVKTSEFSIFSMLYSFLSKKNKKPNFSKKSDFLICTNRFYTFKTHKKRKDCRTWEIFFAAYYARVGLTLYATQEVFISLLIKQNFLTNLKKNRLRPSYVKRFFLIIFKLNFFKLKKTWICLNLIKIR